MFNNTLSGTDQWVTCNQNDYYPHNVLNSSPRYNKQLLNNDQKPTPRLTGRRHFPHQNSANSSIQFGNDKDDIFERQSNASGYTSTGYGTPLTSPRKVARITGARQPPWGVQFVNVVPITLYLSSSSPSSAAVGMVARILGLRMNYVEVNTIANEHKSERFLAHINPAGTIPVINDEGFKLFEFRAILRYLVSKYGYKNNSLYPEDMKTRARIDTWLDYDLGTLNPTVSEFVAPSFVTNSESDSTAEERHRKLEGVLEYINSHLQLSPFICGTQMTIADICLASTLVLLDSVRYDFGSNKSGLCSWLLNIKGNRQFQDSFNSFYTIMGTFKH